MKQAQHSNNNIIPGALMGALFLMLLNTVFARTQMEHHPDPNREIAFVEEKEEQSFRLYHSFELKLYPFQYSKEL